MKIAYNQATCKERSSLEMDLALCRRHGIGEIELRFDMLAQYLSAHSQRELAALVGRSGVKPITLNAIFHINFLDEAARARVDAQFAYACQMGQLLGVDCVVVLPSVVPDGQYSRAQIADDSVRSLRYLAQLGAPYGMRVAFEPVGGPGFCVKGIKDAWAVVAAADHPLVGLALDAYNLYLNKGLSDVDDIGLIDPNKIYIVHIDDAAKDKPRHQLGTYDRVLPGDGAIDLARFVRAVANTGYRGAYSIEILNRACWAMAPETLFAQAYEKTRALLAQGEGV